VVRSGGKVACYPSDLVSDAKHLDPVWVLGYDLYPLETIANKHHLYDVAIREQWLMVFTHDHEMPWAYLKMGDKGRPGSKTAGAHGGLNRPFRHRHHEAAEDPAADLPRRFRWHVFAGERHT
jgi:hypothetical protein